MAQHVWDCILTRSSNDITQALSKTTVPSIPVCPGFNSRMVIEFQIEYNRYLFMPTIDNRDLPAHPLWILNNVPVGGTTIPSAVPYLTGLNLHDGAEVILEDRTLGEFTNFLEVDRQYLHSFVIEYAYRHNYTMNREAIIEAIEAYYTFWPDVSKMRIQPSRASRELSIPSNSHNSVLKVSNIAAHIVFR